MTTQTIKFRAVSLRELPTLTLSVKLQSASATVATLASITEDATINGLYTGTVEDVAAGTYAVQRSLNGVTVDDGTYQVDLLLAVGTYTARTVSAIALTGPYTRTITVTDADTAQPIEGAKVRLYRTGETGTVATDDDGVAAFTVEAATWSYAVTASGYTGVSGSVVVSANGNTNVQITAVSITPPDDPALCAVTIHLRDQYGANLPDQPVEITWVKWSESAAETPPVLSVPPVQTTDSNGLVEVELYRLATYKIVYGNAPYARRIDKTIPDAGSYSLEL